MANVFSRIEKYMTKAVDTVLATESKTAILENGSKYIDVNFDEAGYVKLAEILMDGLSDYYRANSSSDDNVAYTNRNAGGKRDGYHVGNTSLKWRIYPLTQDRGKQFQIDEMDNEETAGLLIANLLTEFLRTHVVPEIDAYRFSTIAAHAYTSLGNLVTETPVTTKGDANEITHLWNKAFEWQTEHGVSEEEQVIFVSPAVWTICANTQEIYKTFTDKTITTERNVDFTFKAYMGRPIIVVPSDRFFDKIVIDHDNGFKPAEGSKVINYIVCSKKCIVPIVKLNKSKIFGPDMNQDFDGYKINFRLYHDVVIPKNKIVGCYVSLSTNAASTKTSLLSVALSKGAAADNYVLDGAYTNPAGMLGEVIYSKTAITLGSTPVSPKKAVEGETFAVEASATTQYFGLIDGSGKVIAISGSVALPR